MPTMAARPSASSTRSRRKVPRRSRTVAATRPKSKGPKRWLIHLASMTAQGHMYAGEEGFRRESAADLRLRKGPLFAGVAHPSTHVPTGTYNRSMLTEARARQSIAEASTAEDAMTRAVAL